VVRCYHVGNVDLRPGIIDPMQRGYHGPIEQEIVKPVEVTGWIEYLMNVENMNYVRWRAEEQCAGLQEFLRREKTSVNGGIKQNSDGIQKTLDHPTILQHLKIDIPAKWEYVFFHLC